MQIMMTDGITTEKSENDSLQSLSCANGGFIIIILPPVADVLPNVAYRRWEVTANNNDKPFAIAHVQVRKIIKRPIPWKKSLAAGNA